MFLCFFFYPADRVLPEWQQLRILKIIPGTVENTTTTQQQLTKSNHFCIIIIYMDTRTNYRVVLGNWSQYADPIVTLQHSHIEGCSSIQFGSDSEM